MIRVAGLRFGRVIGIRMVVTEDDEDEPWTAPPSGRPKERPLPGPLPEKLGLVPAKMYDRRRTGYRAIGYELDRG